MSLLLLALSPLAWPCSPGPCSGGFVVPKDGATVPANLPALVWIPRRGSSGPDGEPELRAASGEVKPLTLENDDGLLLLRAEGLTPGGYTLKTPAHCRYVYGERDRDHTERSFTLGPEAPLPTALGALRVTPGQEAKLEVSTGVGSCSLEVPAATVEVVLEPHASAEPWMPALLFTTLVDGKRWFAAHDLNAEYAPGASWRGRGQDLLFTACGEDADWVDGSLPPGTHTVQLQARLAGQDAMWTSDEVQVELQCPPEGIPAPKERGGLCASGPARGGVGWIGFVLGLVWVRRRRLSG